MTVHYFVRLRPPPHGPRSVREMAVGARRYSADAGWALLERGEAVSLRSLYHPDERARCAFSYAFDVVAVAYPDVLPTWIVSAGKPTDATYEAKLSSIASNEFAAFEYAGHLLTAAAQWVPVTREQAEFLHLTPSILSDLNSARAFEARAHVASATVAGRPVGHSAPIAASIDADADAPANVAESHESGADEPDAPPASESPDEELDGATDALAGETAGALSLDERVLRALGAGPLAASEIARALGMAGVSGHLQKTVQALVQRNAVELTIPDKPGSRLQQYRLVPAPAVTPDGPVERATVPASGGALRASSPAEHLSSDQPSLSGTPANLGETTTAEGTAPLAPHAESASVVVRVMGAEDHRSVDRSPEP